METIDPKLLAMASATLLTRLTAHLERQGALPLGWTATELRAAAVAAKANMAHSANPDLHEAFAAALRRMASMSIQPLDGAGADLTDPPGGPHGDRRKRQTGVRSSHPPASAGTATTSPDKLPLRSVGPEDEARGGHEAPASGPGPTVPGTGPRRTRKR
jgi:hypothetical protein